MPWSPPGSAVEQPLGRGRVVGWQDDEVRHRLLQREHLPGGLDQLTADTHAGNLSPTEQLGPIGEVADRSNCDHSRRRISRDMDPAVEPGVGTRDQRTVSPDT